MMNDADYPDMRTRLEEFSKRLENRVHELKEQGVFSDVHENFIKAIRRRRQEIGERIALAERSGQTLSLIQSELKRDFDAFFDDLREFNERLDAEQMKPVTRPA